MKMFDLNSILKKEKYRVNFNKKIEVTDLIDTNKILRHDFSKNNLYINGFVVSKKERYFFVEQSQFFNTEEFYQLLSELIKSPNVYNKYSNMILIIKNKKHFVCNDFNELIKFLYFNLVVYLEIAAYKYKNNIDNSQEQVRINKIVRKKLDFSEKQKSNTITKYKRSKIHEKSKHCLFWNCAEYSQKIPKSLLNIIIKLNVKELEFPLKYDKTKTTKLLKNLLYILEYIGLEDRNFELRFKKIGHYKKEGLYIKNAKCIIVNPLYSNTLFHELGHHIYENKLSFNFKNEQFNSNNYKKIIEQNTDKYSKQIKNHKIEELDFDSEIFAYWFEEQMISLL